MTVSYTHGASEHVACIATGTFVAGDADMVLEKFGRPRHLLRESPGLRCRPFSCKRVEMITDLAWPRAPSA